MRLKKEDPIIVLRGKDKGRKGKIEKVFNKSGKVLITGVNVYKRHTRSGAGKKSGGIVEFSRPLPASSVSLVCPKCTKKTRIAYHLDKSGSKTRICAKCKSLL
ncbi:MAG: 50S ribosomal protein L24 [Patescibacteria group bacterium]